jgi:hypothetical protein
VPWQVVERNGRMLGVPPVVRGAQSFSGQPASASAAAGRMPGWQAQGCKPHGLPHGALWSHGPRLLSLHPALVNLAQGPSPCCSKCMSCCCLATSLAGSRCIACLQLWDAAAWHVLLSTTTDAANGGDVQAGMPPAAVLKQPACRSSTVAAEAPVHHRANRVNMKQSSLANSTRSGAGWHAALEHAGHVHTLCHR